MTVAAAEMYVLPGMSASDFGQAVSVPGRTDGLTEYALVSYITSPVTIGTRQDYVVFVLGVFTAAGNIFPIMPTSYRWKVVASPGNWVLGSAETDEGIWNWEARPVGNVTVSVELMDGATVLTTLQLDQTVRDLNQDVVDHIAANGLSRTDVLHELMIDFYPYIKAAVLASGTTGIPAAMIAACLYQEMLSRFREGTPEAAVYRKSLEQAVEGEEKPGWGDYLLSLEPKKAAEVYYGREDDRVREVELELIRGFYDGAIVFRYSGGKSLGVGQLRQSTAAMVRGLIPWREWTRDPSNKRSIATQIDDDWSNLTREQKIGLFNLLRFPKTCIRLVGDFLSLLKNRPFTRTADASTTTRWPTLTRAQLLVNEQAASVIGQEFNIGASTTPAATAKASHYGEFVWRYMHQKSNLDPDRFFPEPP
jgi:hypothetical protein